MQALQFPTPSDPPPAPEAEIGIIETVPKATKPYRRLAIAAVIIAIAGVAAASIPTRSASAVDPAGFAELFVRSYLTEAAEGSEATLSPYLGYSPGLDGIEADQWYVAGTTTVSIDETRSGATVIVAADTLGRIDSGYGDREVQYFEVTLMSESSGLIAASLPRRVAGPSQSTTEVTRTPIGLPDAATHAVTDYLEWFLTGSDGAYTDERPQTSYTHIAVTGLYALHDGAVEVELIATDGAGRSLPMHYFVVVEESEGRWVVELP